VFIFNQQNRLRAADTYCVWDRCLRRFQGLRADGQVHTERAAFAKFAVNIDEAVVLLDDAVDGGQAESGSLADFLFRIEGFKNMRQGLLIHAATVIADSKHGIIAGQGLGVLLAIVVRDRRLGGFDGDAACTVDRIPRVDAQVGENLVDLSRVDFNGV